MFNVIRNIFIPGLCLAMVLTFSVPTARADIIPHGHDCETAASIELNTKVPGSLAGIEDTAVYRIVLEQRGLIDIWIDPGNFDVWSMDLLDASCKRDTGVLPGDSVITGKYVNLSVPGISLFPAESIWTLAPGTYFIRLKPDSIRVYEEMFTLHTLFTPHYGHDCETAEPADLSRTVDGSLLYSDDREVFRVSVPAAGRLHAWAKGSFAGGNEPVVGLHFADCTSAADLLPDNRGFTSRVFGQGTYYVSVRPSNPDSLGPFILHFEFEPEAVSLSVAAPVNPMHWYDDIRLGRLEMVRKPDGVPRMCFELNNVACFDPNAAWFDLHWLQK